jgi:serine/threonine protein kinase
MPVLPLEPGTIVYGRYRILRPIGKGGMGAVYEAIDRRLHNSVALKLMTAQGADADRAFEQEAQLLAALRHSGLPGVIDYFIEDEYRWLVMQYIDGEDLEHLRKRQGGSCEPRDVLAWGVDVLNVLAFLHRHDPPVIHRDVKPSNLKLTPSGEMVVLDFGLAKGGHESTSTTHLDADQRSIYGFTPHYAPPEQREGRGTDARSDLYALGATLYHLVTGIVPVGADARAAAFARDAADPLPPAHRVKPSVSEAFSAVLSRALQLDPALRYQRAEDMRDALAELRQVDKEAPRGREARGSRRIDAAMPSQAEVGHQVDLIVQVRFASSPRLGIEDWPSKRVPDRIEQASEDVDLEYPIDPRTRQQLPARLRVKIVAPDFTIDGTADCLIEVPPNAYSKRLAFLLTPRHVGLCRVHVEVYALDMLHMGTVPIEADAVAVQVANPVWRVAHLVMQMFTGGGSARPPVLFEEYEHDPTRIIGSRTILVGDGDVPEMDAGHSFSGRDDYLLAPTHEPRPDIVAGRDARMTSSHPRTSRRRLYSGIVIGGSLTVLLIGILSVPRMVLAPNSEVATVVTPPMVATDTGSPAAASRPTLSMELTGPRALATARSISDPRVEVRVTAIERRRSVVRIELVFSNAGPEPVRVALDTSRVRLASSADRGYSVIADSAGTKIGDTFSGAVLPGRRLEHWLEFRVPDTVLGGVELTIEGSRSDQNSLSFAPLSFTLPVT